MARRTPIAHGLEEQLNLLDKYGYRVVPVSELMALSPYLDLPQTDPRAAAARKLEEAGWCPAFRDNTLRPETPLTRGALAMMAFGWEGVPVRVSMISGNPTIEVMCEDGKPVGAKAATGRPSPWADVKPNHPYAGALMLAADAGCLAPSGKSMRPDAPITAEETACFLAAKLGYVPGKVPNALTHGQLFLLAAEALETSNA